MRRWMLAGTGASCGLCGDGLPKGAPCLELSGAGWRKVRCERCAGEPKPDHVAETRPGLELRKRAAGAKPLAALAADFKHAQGGDR